jgi:hypothetical protein
MKSCLIDSVLKIFLHLTIEGTRKIHAKIYDKKFYQVLPIYD